MEVYAIIYQQHEEILQALHIRLCFELAPEVSIIPAYTNAPGSEMITVFFQYWFLRDASLGQLIGMANHELAVHSLTSIVFNTLRGQTIAALTTQIAILSNPPNPDPTPNRTRESLALCQSCLDFANSAFGRLLQTMATSNLAEIRINLADYAHVLTLILNGLHLNISPRTVFSNQGYGVDEHIEAASLSFTPGEPIEMLPRAAAYLVISFQSVETLVREWPGPANDPALLQNVTDILFFYFLDIARTWVETRADDWLRGLNNFYYADFLMRPLLASMPDIIAGILSYLDRIIPHAPAHIPNVLANTLTGASTAVVLSARPGLEHRLRNLRSELIALWFRAVADRVRIGSEPQDG